MGLGQFSAFVVLVYLALLDLLEVSRAASLSTVTSTPLYKAMLNSTVALVGLPL